MARLQVSIDDIQVYVEEGTTLLEAAKMVNIDIPTLCYHPDQSLKGSCRVCVVEVEGQKNLSAACCTPVWDGMVIKTHSKRVRQARKMIVEMLMADHNCDCLTCVRSGNCELQNICESLYIEETPLPKVVKTLPIHGDNPSIVRDVSKCIKCGRCIEVCHDVQKVGAIYTKGRSCKMEVGTPFGKDLSSVQCVYCGQCINVCPVGAIYEKDDRDRVWKVLEDPNKFVVVQVAPAVRVALGESFNMEPGTILTNKMVTFLRKIGFDKVFDTNFTADLTIMEEGHELLHRLSEGGKLPMLTSCSPGWIRYIENFYPDLLDHVSTCKSPQQMFGALAKAYYADKVGIEPKDMIVVSIMPCTAKKAESLREEMKTGDIQDVDIVLTTRELVRMIKDSRLDFDALEASDFDQPFGISTGAAVIFGATGGVMEAALRTVYEVVTGQDLETIDFREVRGLQGFKEAKVKVGNLEVKVAVVNSLGHAKQLLDRIRAGKADYHFVEVMCCPGGCIGGGGQPIPSNQRIKEMRRKGLYTIDQGMGIRKSHQNPVVLALYEAFLEKPLSHKAHRLLHTHYVDRSKS